MVKATLIGAVRRIIEPGCSRRNVLVFQGGQGVLEINTFAHIASASDS